MSSTVMVNRQLFSAKTTGTFILPESTGFDGDPYVSGKALGNNLEYTFYVVFGAGTGAGTLKIETAHDPAFTGTWAVIATVTWATVSTVHYVALTQVLRAVRVRFSADVTGGTADCYYIASSR